MMRDRAAVALVIQQSPSYHPARGRPKIFLAGTITRREMAALAVTIQQLTSHHRARIRPGANITRIWIVGLPHQTGD
jgi:hypothetical protein